MKKVMLILAAFFINHDSYAALSEGKMSKQELEAARTSVQKELQANIDLLFDDSTALSCLEQVSSNSVDLGGDQVQFTGVESDGGLLGKIARNELTAAEVDEALTRVTTSRIIACTLTYLPSNLN